MPADITCRQSFRPSVFQPVKFVPARPLACRLPLPGPPGGRRSGQSASIRACAVKYRLAMVIDLHYARNTTDVGDQIILEQTNPCHSSAVW